MESLTNQTLYINNLNEKLKKDVLKRALYMIFSEFGKIVDVVACKGLKMRGQAWVVFHDVNAATNAIRRRQGFNFYGKPLRIAYANAKSDVIAKKDGTFTPRQKREREDSSSKASAASQQTQSDSNGGDSSQHPSKSAKIVVNNVPHRILFAQNLPDECNDQILTQLFQTYPGFQEVRMVPGKKGIAFIEFQDLIQAGIALQQLHGFKLNTTDVLQLTYGNQ